MIGNILPGPTEAMEVRTFHNRYFKSTITRNLVKSSSSLHIVSQARPFPFYSADCFQYVARGGKCLET